MTPFSAADLRARLPRLTGRAPVGVVEEIGDHILNPDWAQLAERPAAREAAVLVPVVDDPAGATLILTRRADSLRKHSGQVAFPGGSIDPEDASAEAAALRESREEIGLDDRFVETLGRLPPYRTTTGFRITPVIAIVTPGFTLAPNPVEVADVFEVPLAFLMDAANHRRESRMFEGRERFYYSMPFGGQIIWGVTAGIVRALYERLYA